MTRALLALLLDATLHVAQPAPVERYVPPAIVAPGPLTAAGHGALFVTGAAVSECEVVRSSEVFVVVRLTW